MINVSPIIGVRPQIKRSVLDTAFDGKASVLKPWEHPLTAIIPEGILTWNV